jgi:hypothetical protein
MNQLYKYLLVLLLAFATLLSNAQEAVVATDSTVVEPLILPKANNLFNAQLTFTIPNAVSNKSFAKSFVGIYQVGGNLNLSVYKNLHIGVAFSDALMQVSKNVIPNKTYAKQPYLNFYNAAIRIGGDFYVGDKNRVLFLPSLTVGQSTAKFSGFVAKSPAKSVTLKDYKSPYAQADVGLIFLVEENWGIGPTLSYTLVQHNFNPNDVCLEEWATYSSNSSGSTQYLSFGFVCYYSFFKK